MSGPEASSLPATRTGRSRSSRLRSRRSPPARVAMRPFADLAPERFVGAIAPRPVLMVNGIDDPQIPAAAVRTLYDALRPPRELIWLRTGHLMPDDTLLVRALVDTALARLPVLRGGPPAAAVGRHPARRVAFLTAVRRAAKR